VLWQPSMSDSTDRVKHFDADQSTEVRRARWQPLAWGLAGLPAGFPARSLPSRRRHWKALSRLPRTPGDSDVLGPHRRSGLFWDTCMAVSRPPSWRTAALCPPHRPQRPEIQ